MNDEADALSHIASVFPVGERRIRVEKAVHSEAMITNDPVRVCLALVGAAVTMLFVFRFATLARGRAPGKGLGQEVGLVTEHVQRQDSNLKSLL